MYMYIHIYIYIIYYIIYLIHIAHVSLDMDEIWWHKRSEMATARSLRLGLPQKVGCWSKIPRKIVGMITCFGYFFWWVLNVFLLAQFWGKFVINTLGILGNIYDLNTLGYWGLYEQSPMTIPGMGDIHHVVNPWFTPVSQMGHFGTNGVTHNFSWGDRGMWLWYSKCYTSKHGILL